MPVQLYYPHTYVQLRTHLTTLTGLNCMQLLLTMDDAAAEWYSYHFHDTLFLNDTAWVYWHTRLKQLLTEDQLQGRACAFCGLTLAVPGAKPHNFAHSIPESPRSLKNSSQGDTPPKALTQYIAGYTIRCCREPCHITFD